MSEQHAVEQQTVQPDANGQEAVAAQQPKPRSGYARLRTRHRNLIVEKENWEAAFRALRQELLEWRGMYLQLQQDLAPLIEAKSNE